MHSCTLCVCVCVCVCVCARVHVLVGGLCHCVHVWVGECVVTYIYSNTIGHQCVAACLVKGPLT